MIFRKIEPSTIKTSAIAAAPRGSIPLVANTAYPPHRHHRAGEKGRCFHAEARRIWLFPVGGPQALTGMAGAFALQAISAAL